MAVGDGFAVILGTAVTNRQPSAGVEEQVTAALKDGGTDPLVLYDGSLTVPFLTGGTRTYSPDPNSNADSPHMDFFNTAILITNSVYIRKTGTTERIYAGGVQVG